MGSVIYKRTSKSSYLQVSKDFYNSPVTEPSFNQVDFYIPEATTVNFSASSTSSVPCSYIDLYQDQPYAILTSIQDSNEYFDPFIEAYLGLSSVKKTAFYGPCVNNDLINIGVDEQVELAAGWYRLVVEAANKCFVSAHINYEDYGGFRDTTLSGGGLRIKQIRDFEISGAEPYIRSFNYKTNNNESSGRLHSFPAYTFDTRLTYFYRDIKPAPRGPIETMYLVDEPMRVTRSSSFSALNLSKGSPVGYSVVEEVFAGRGKEIDRYFDGEFSQTFNIPPLESIANGAPIFKVVLDSNSDTIQTVENFYYADQKSNNNKMLRALAIETYPVLTDLGNAPLSTGLAPSYLLSPYLVYLQWWKLYSTKIVDYTSGGKISTIRNLVYNDINRQVYLKSESQSDGSVNVEKYNYPSDYSSSASPVFLNMISNNMVNPIVEVQKWRIVGGMNSCYLAR